MKTRLLAVLLLSVSAFATTPVTGHIAGLDTTTPGASAFVRFILRGMGGNQPRITGTGAIAPLQGGNGLFYVDLKADASGNVSGTIYSTRDAAGTGNGEIEVGGSYTAVYYGMLVYNNGIPGPEIRVHANNGVTLDISNVTPISTTPVVTAPTGDTTYCRIDGGNCGFTGPISSTSSISPKDLITSSTPVSDPRASVFSGADLCARTMSAIAAFPTIGGYKAGVISWFGYAGTTQGCASAVTVSSPYVSIIGPGPGALQVTCPTGDCLRINTSAFTTNPAGMFSGFQLNVPASGNGIHIGDIVGATLSDIFINCNGNASTNGVWFDNQTNWTERTKVAGVTLYKCSKDYRFTVNGGTSSFGYTRILDSALNVDASQIGFSVEGAATPYNGTFIATVNVNNSSGTVLSATGGANLNKNFYDVTAECTGCSGNGTLVSVDATSVVTGFGQITGLTGLVNSVTAGGVYSLAAFAGEGTASSFPVTLTISGTDDRTIALNPVTPLGTGAATIKLFRSVNTSGTVRFSLTKADGSNTETFGIDPKTGNTTITGTGNQFAIADLSSVNGVKHSVSVADDGSGGMIYANESTALAGQFSQWRWCRATNNTGGCALFGFKGDGTNTVNWSIDKNGKGTFNGGAQIGSAGSALLKYARVTPSISPSLVAANTTAEQCFSGTLTSGDVLISVSKPTAQAGLGIVGWRANGTSACLTFSNNTAGSITPTASETYQMIVVQ